MATATLASKIEKAPDVATLRSLARETSDPAALVRILDRMREKYDANPFLSDAEKRRVRTLLTFDRMAIGIAAKKAELFS